MLSLRPAARLSPRSRPRLPGRGALRVRFPRTNVARQPGISRPRAKVLGVQQLDGADLASCGESNSRYYLRAGQAAHLEAVRRPRIPSREEQGESLEEAVA